jgi:hypothetical protein
MGLAVGLLSISNSSVGEGRAEGPLGSAVMGLAVGLVSFSNSSFGDGEGRAEEPEDEGVEDGPSEGDSNGSSQRRSFGRDGLGRPLLPPPPPTILLLSSPKSFHLNLFSFSFISSIPGAATLS